MTQENVIKKDNRCKKVPLELIISILLMVIAAVTSIVIAEVTIKQEPADDPVIIELYGDYSRTADSNFQAGEVLTKKHNITGSLKSGTSYVGFKEHDFDTGGGTVEIEFFLDSEGTIIGYRFIRYGHSRGGWRTSIENYLNAFINTKATDISTTMAANKDLYAGATETGEHTVDVILLALEVEVNN